MYRITAFCLVVILGYALPASAAAPPRPDTSVRSTSSASLAEQAFAVLRQHCAACHGGPDRAKGGFGYLFDHHRLVHGGQVLPGQPGRSPLYERTAAGEMPPAGKPKLSPAELTLLRKWIEAGAPALPQSTGPALVETEVWKRVRADLETVPPRQRRFVRYLTLHHLSALTEEERQNQRYALSKLVNSLSWHPRLKAPVPVEPTRLVYRVDLRDYRWSTSAWSRLALRYPYAPTQPGEVVRTVQRWTAEEGPLLRVDWFLANASRPPFYHDFLQLPNTDRALERLLQVDVLNNLEEDNALRAGFNGSGVARANRLLERHDAAHGAYWRSYDFNDNIGRNNLFERPLGPMPGPLGFEHAGGEAIFNLPNGLQAYLLFDGDGRRVDKAPTEIVSDPNRPDRRVENGISCIGCHVQGILPKDDQVRAQVLKGGQKLDVDSRARLLALYAPASRMRAQMKEDADRFNAALVRLGLSVGEKEPVLTAVLRYEEPLDVRSAAAALSVLPEELVKHLRGESEFSRILGPLQAMGGTVQRQVFEEAFPKLARELRFGVETLVAVANPEKTIPGEFRLPETPEIIHCLAVSADGRLAVTGDAKGDLRLWDLVAQRQKAHLQGHRDVVSVLRFMPDGKRLLSAGRDRTLRVWDIETGRSLLVLRGHTDIVRALAILPDGQHVLSAGDDRAIRLWDVRTGSEVRAWAGHTGSITALAVSPDGRRLLSASLDRSVRLWDLPSGRPLARWDGHAAAVQAVAFSPDGKQALSGGSDRSIRLWDVATGRQLRVMTGHDASVIAVSFSADGQQAVSAATRYETQGRALRRWSLSTGTEVSSADPKRVEAVALGPGGLWIQVVAEGTLRRWTLP